MALRSLPLRLRVLPPFQGAVTRARMIPPLPAQHLLPLRRRPLVPVLRRASTATCGS